MQIEKLSNHPELIPVVVKWWFDEWSHLNPSSKNTLEAAIQSLQDKINNEGDLPYILLAFKNGQVVGVASLKLHELREYFPDTPYWLGSVYVDKPARGAGVASKLIKEIEKAAVGMNILTLHLATEQLDGGLYKRLGWQPVSEVVDRGDVVLVMRKGLNKC